MKYQNYIKKAGYEIIRDFTGFGSPLVIIIISLMFVGISLKFLYIILGLAIIELICDTIKIFYEKERPNKEEYRNILEKIQARSFPSVHSARSIFAFIVFFTLTSSLALKLLFLFLVIAVGFSRVFLKKHYLVDVIAGYIIGMLILMFFLSLSLI